MLFTSVLSILTCEILDCFIYRDIYVFLSLKSSVSHSGYELTDKICSIVMTEYLFLASYIVKNTRIIETSSFFSKYCGE